MKEILAAALACGLLASPAFAASANIETAVKTFAQVGADAAKLKTYCEMSKVMSSGEDNEDESKSEALDKQMQTYMKELGPDFESAFGAGADLDPDSEDGKAYDAALEALDGKCSQ
jgi:hypothetical protein